MRVGGGWMVGGGVALALVLTACGDKPEDKARPLPTPAAGASLAPADTLAPRYEATLTDGIDFRKRGYPNFVAEVSGISGVEDWGRWSDAGLGPSVRIRFRQPLPATFTLEIMASAFGPNLGQPVRVRVGPVERTFAHGDAFNPGTYSLKFDSIGGADTVEIFPPKPVSPAEFAGTRDVRVIGIGLVSLKVLD